MATKVGKLIYEGQLAKKIILLKCVSITSSTGIGGSLGYLYWKKGFSVALGGMGFLSMPFFMSPILITWFFKRYITKLYYDQETDTYAAHHYGLLLNKKVCTFKKEEVKISKSMLNTFTVGRRPFFLHDEDLKDAESVVLYKRMLGLTENESK